MFQAGGKRIKKKKQEKKKNQEKKKRIKKKESRKKECLEVGGGEQKAKGGLLKKIRKGKHRNLCRSGCIKQYLIHGYPSCMQQGWVAEVI